MCLTATNESSGKIPCFANITNWKMKLAIATSILAQALPVVSETKLSAWLSSRNGRKLKPGEAFHLVEAVDKVTGYHTRKRRVDARDDKVKSKTAARSARALENQPVASSDMKYQTAAICDPSSMDPDVGVLSCGPGGVCTPSMKSVLGGICTPKKKPRMNASSHQKAASQVAKAKKVASLGRRLKNEGANNDSLQCDPWSSNPDTGVLSCKEGRDCKPSKMSPLGGECLLPSDVLDGTIKTSRFAFPNKQEVLRNIRIPRSQNNSSPIECDPTVADIGILPCGSDASCVKSNDAKMGGFCETSMTHRRTSMAYDGPSSLCEGPSYQETYFSCKCEDFDSTTKSGSITCTDKEEVCFGSMYYGCYGTCATRSFTQVIENDTSTSSKSCINFSTPKAESFCRSYRNDRANCEVEFNGETCNSCSYEGYNLNFDCSNISGGPVLSGDGWYITSLPIIQECYKPVDGEYCNLCGYDMFIPHSKRDKVIPLSGFGDILTCYRLQEAQWSNQISTDKCTEASAVAQASCCAYRCNLCGYGGIVPYKNDATLVTISGEETTCGALQGLASNYSISKEQCVSVYEAVANACCEPTCDVCNSSFIPYGKFNTPVNITGFEDILTCGDMQSAVYPYSYIYGSRNVSIYGDSCPAAVEIAESACCASFCNLCSYNGVIPPRKFDTLVSIPGFEHITTCGDLQNSAYNYFNITGENCPAFSAIAESYCCSDICNVCNSSFIPFERREHPVYISGFENVSTCGDLMYAAYSYFTITGESCPAFTEIAESNCCAYFCDICGPKAYISYDNYGVKLINVPGVGNATCGDIVYSYQFDLDSDTCPTVVSFVRDTCCSEFNMTYYDPCYICGVGNDIANPLATIILPDGSELGDCSLFGTYAEQGLYDTYACGYLQSLVTGVCCDGNVNASDSDADTATDIMMELTSEEGDTTANSPAKKLWTVKSSTSLMAITAATFFWLAG